MERADTIKKIDDIDKKIARIRAEKDDVQQKIAQLRAKMGTQRIDTEKDPSKIKNNEMSGSDLIGAAVGGGIIGGLGTILEMKGIDPNAVMTTTQLLQIAGNALWGSLSCIGMLGLGMEFLSDVAKISDKVMDAFEQSGKAMMDTLPQIIGDTVGKVSEKINLIAQVIGQKSQQIAQQIRNTLHHHEQNQNQDNDLCR